MKDIWLPDSLYRLKPLILMLTGAILLLVSKNLFLSLFAAACIGFAAWILFMRMIWSNADNIKTHVGSNQAGQSRTLYVEKTHT
jgi:hypothetical protein